MSRRSRTPSRALTTFAVGFLLLDGVLLTYSGLALHRTMLVVWGVACVAAAGLVVLGWRRYRRAMADLERGERAVAFAAIHAQLVALAIGRIAEPGERLAEGDEAHIKATLLQGFLQFVKLVLIFVEGVLLNL